MDRHCISSRLAFASLHVKVDDMSTIFFYKMVLLLVKSVVRTRRGRKPLVISYLCKG